MTSEQKKALVLIIVLVVVLGGAPFLRAAMIEAKEQREAAEAPQQRPVITVIEKR